MHTGVSLAFNELVPVTEGGTRDVCLIVTEDARERERDVHISLMVTSNGITSSMRVIIVVHKTSTH